MKNVENQIISVIYGHGRGWVFSQKDFASLAQPSTIDRGLSRLAEKGSIRRISRGLYDYPRFGKLLAQSLAPSMDQAAQALARKFGWSIQVSGNAALNILGLSTQTPTQYLYLSDGPSKAYDIAGQALVFKKSKMTHVDFKYPESTFLVQAISALGKDALTSSQQSMIRQYFQVDGQIPKALVSRVLKDTQYVTSWVFQAIKTLFVEQDATH